LQTPPTPDVTLHFDDDASPWHTLLHPRGTGRRAALHDGVRVGRRVRHRR
jgi:hypothetical protein